MLIVVVMLVIPMASARLQYYSTKEITNNDVKLHLFGGYTNSVDDFVTGGNPLEVYIWYNIYPKSWNEANPNNLIDNCNLTIIKSGSMTNASQVYYATYTPEDLDITNTKYFLQLKNSESFTADIICEYNSNSTKAFDLPASIQLVEPTTECKTCQFYEWSVESRAVTKAEDIDTKRKSVWGYVGNLFSINLEIFIDFFWFALIIIVLLTISLIFSLLIWIYKAFKRLGGLR